MNTISAYQSLLTVELYTGVTLHGQRCLVMDFTVFLTLTYLVLHYTKSHSDAKLVGVAKWVT